MIIMTEWSDSRRRSGLSVYIFIYMIVVMVTFQQGSVD